MRKRTLDNFSCDYILIFLISWINGMNVLFQFILPYFCFYGIGQRNNDLLDFNELA